MLHTVTQAGTAMRLYALNRADQLLGGAVSHAVQGNLHILFMRGADFRMEPARVERDRFVVAFNGSTPDQVEARVYHAARKALFLDQALFQNLLYRPETLTRADFRHMASRRMVEMYADSLAGTERLVLRRDFPEWVRVLRETRVSFSYGSRMHGNVLALLSGIPCFVRVPDMRVEEMVRFYRIPNSLTTPFDEKRDDLYDLYASLDWSDFNANYAVRQAAFARLLDTIAPAESEETTSFPPFAFDPEVQCRFSAETLHRLRRALTSMRLRTFRYLAADVATLGLRHAKYAAKYARYFAA